MKVGIVLTIQLLRVLFVLLNNNWEVNMVIGIFSLRNFCSPNRALFGRIHPRFCRTAVGLGKVPKGKQKKSHQCFMAIFESQREQKELQLAESIFAKWKNFLLNLLERTFSKKMSRNPKIGLFCDVTAYRIFLFGHILISLVGIST